MNNDELYIRVHIDLTDEEIASLLLSETVIKIDKNHSPEVQVSIQRTIEI